MRLFCMGEGGLRSAPNVVSCEPCVFGRALPGGDRPAAPMNSTRWLATSSSPLFSVLTGEWEARDLGNRAMDTLQTGGFPSWGLGGTLVSSRATTSALVVRSFQLNDEVRVTVSVTDVRFVSGPQRRWCLDAARALPTPPLPPCIALA